MALSVAVRAFREVPKDIRQWTVFWREAFTSALSGSVDTALIEDAAVTFAKIQHIATDTLLGRSTAGTGAVESITCTAAGRALIDDADATAQRATLNITSGTYSPSLTNQTNVAASTSYAATYSRNNDVVTVAGKVDIDPTAAASTLLGISLPIASNIAAQEDVGGVAFCPAVAREGAAIHGDAANDRATLEYVATDTANRSFHYVFQYRIL